jgi:hypothetical protein
MKNITQIIVGVLMICCVICTTAMGDGNEIINGGFETGNISGWTVSTDESGPGNNTHIFTISEEHNYSGMYGCELYTDTFFISTSSISLIQNVNLTDIDYITFNHQCTYEYSGTNTNNAYSQLEFYVDDDITTIPLFNNSSIIDVWKKQAIDVSSYTGFHNITIRLYSTAPGQPYCATAKVEIDDVIFNDWNPWNDLDSEGSPDGRYITENEVNEAYSHLMSSTPVPITGAPMTATRLIEMYRAYVDQTPM